MTLIYQLFLTKKAKVTSSYGVVGTPYHVLIDKQGKIAYQTFLATDELDEKIDNLCLKQFHQVIHQVIQ